MTTLNIATWNLDGYGRGAAGRLPRQLETLQSLGADVLVLTEVRSTMRLPGMVHWWSAPGAPPYKPTDHAVCIASRWPGRQLPVIDERLSVCVALQRADDPRCLIAYGTIIPYKQDGVRQKAATPWQRHRQAVRDVVADIQRLQNDPAYRDAHVLLAGDFNTGLDGSRWYGDAEARSALVEGLSQAGLHCRTLENIRESRGSERAIVDHIWTSASLQSVGPLHIWCDRAEPGRLSDHNGVALRLASLDHTDFTGGSTAT